MKEYARSSLQFREYHGCGLNNKSIKLSNGDVLTLGSMSSVSKSNNHLDLDLGIDMKEHFIEDFVLQNNNKKYEITREVIMYSPSKVRGNAFKSRILDVVELN